MFLDFTLKLVTNFTHCHVAFSSFAVGVA